PFLFLGLRKICDLWKDYSLSWSRLKLKDKIFRYSLGWVVIGILIFFSTVPRIVSQPLHFLYLRLSEADVAEDVQKQMPQYYYKEEQELADHLKLHMKAEDQVFIWGNSIGIYYFLNKYPSTIVLTNTPL